jgi:hypothetical protein
LRGRYAVAAGDQRHALGQPAEAAVTLLAVLGARRQLSLAPRRIDRLLRELGLGTLVARVGGFGDCGDDDEVMRRRSARAAPPPASAVTNCYT